MTTTTKITDVLENAEDYTILRIDILAEGASFGGEITQDCALILEDEHGHQTAIEFVEIEDVCDFLVYPEYDSLINHFRNNSIQLNEPGIEFSIQDSLILQQMEQFRFSTNNVSNLYKINKNFY